MDRIDESIKPDQNGSQTGETEGKQRGKRPIHYPFRPIHDDGNLLQPLSPSRDLPPIRPIDDHGNWLHPPSPPRDLPPIRFLDHGGYWRHPLPPLDRPVHRQPPQKQDIVKAEPAEAAEVHPRFGQLRLPGCRRNPPRVARLKGEGS